MHNSFKVTLANRTKKRTKDTLSVNVDVYLFSHGTKINSLLMTSLVFFYTNFDS